AGEHDEGEQDRAAASTFLLARSVPVRVVFVVVVVVVVAVVVVVGRVGEEGGGTAHARRAMGEGLGLVRLVERPGLILRELPLGGLLRARLRGVADVAVRVRVHRCAVRIGQGGAVSRRVSGWGGCPAGRCRLPVPVGLGAYVRLVLVLGLGLGLGLGFPRKLLRYVRLPRVLTVLRG